MHIVVVGAGYAGIAIARTVYHLDASINLTIICPSDLFIPPPSTPRLAVENDLIEVAAKPISQLLDGIKYDHIKGYATGLEPSKSKITVDDTRVVSYDYLIIASGTRASAAYKLLDPQETVNALKHISQVVKTGKSIAVVGGGATGVETASEIKYANSLLNVDIYTSNNQLTPFFHPRRIEGVESKVASIGVKVIRGVTIDHFNDTRVTIDGDVTEYDLVIDATGVKPNSNWIPEDLLQNGYLITDNTLTTKYDNIFGYGDILALGINTITDQKFYQFGVLKSTLQRRVFGKNTKQILLKDKRRLTCLVPITKSMGVGEIFEIPVPSFLVTLAKSRNYGVYDTVPEFSKY